MRKQAMDYPSLQVLARQERLPAALVDLDAFDRNVERVARIVTERAPGQSIRVATKSIRVPSLIARVLRHGSPFRGLMCFSAEEAGFLASLGHDDLLVAYPTWQPSDLSILRRLHDEGKSIQLVVDSLECASHVDAFMIGNAGGRGEGSGAARRPFELILEIDLALRFLGGRVHLGARRSPVRTVEQVFGYLDSAQALRHVKTIGLMGYESQVAGLGDRNPVNRFLNPAIRFVRRLSARKIARLRREIAGTLRARGHELRIFNGAGTGSLSYAVREPWLTELTAGSGFLLPHLFDHYSNLSLEPAFCFALQAVRAPDPGWVACQGGGFIASGAPGWDKVPIPAWPEGSRLSGDEGCGEVQTPVRLAPGVAVRPGEPVLFRHAKAGELAERVTEYLLVSKGRLVERARTYRGLGQCFF